MSAYIAPLEDIRFVLWELSDLDLMAALPEVAALIDTELRESILEQAARFATDVLAPLDVPEDHEALYRHDGAVRMPQSFRFAREEFVQAGWHSISMPAEHGGQGLPNLLCTALQEMFTSANRVFHCGVELTALAVKALIASDGDAQCRKWLPTLVSGRWSATMSAVESRAGSDLVTLPARAQAGPDGSWRLFGQRSCASYGLHDLSANVLHLVEALLPGSAEGGVARVGLFGVPRHLPDGRRNDIRCTRIQPKQGVHDGPTSTLLYGGDGEGAIGWLVGHGRQGAAPSFDTMYPSASLAVGHECLATSERAYQQALASVREQLQGFELARDAALPVNLPADVRRMLQTMRCQTEAVRAVGYVLSASCDLAARHPDADVRRSRDAFLRLMMPVYNGWAAETSSDVMGLSAQARIGDRASHQKKAKLPLCARHVSADVERITSMLAQDLVEKQLLCDGGAALREWLARVHSTVQRLAMEGAPDLEPIRGGLSGSVSALQRACNHAFAIAKVRPHAMLGGSAALLRLFGLVAGGWQLANAALAARRQLEEGGGEPVFLGAKIDSALFYAVHFLPHARALANLVCSDEELGMSLVQEAL